MKDFLNRLLSRKLLVTLTAILATLLDGGAVATRTIIVAVVATIYVLAEAMLDRSNKLDVGKAIGEMRDLHARAMAEAATLSPPPPASPVVVNVTSLPPPPADLATSPSTPPTPKEGS